jgi:hypothetical protein
MAKSKKAKPSYSISLKLGDTTIKSEGATPLATLAALKKPVKLLTKGILTISHGDLKKTMLLMPPKLAPLSGLT